MRSSPSQQSNAMANDRTWLPIGDAPEGEGGNVFFVA